MIENCNIKTVDRPKVDCSTECVLRNQVCMGKIVRSSAVSGAGCHRLCRIRPNSLRSDSDNWRVAGKFFISRKTVVEIAVYRVCMKVNFMKLC